MKKSPTDNAQWHLSLFGPDLVCLQLIAVSHHSTEKVVKKDELFEKKESEDDEKKITRVPINICHHLALMWLVCSSYRWYLIVVVLVGLQPKMMGKRAWI